MGWVVWSYKSQSMKDESDWHHFLRVLALEVGSQVSNT